jgi:hypothetical protein
MLGRCQGEKKKMGKVGKILILARSPYGDHLRRQVNDPASAPVGRLLLIRDPDALLREELG